MTFEELKNKLYRENPKLAISTALGELVRHVREAEGLTQEELAKKLHTKQEAISRLENGKVEASLSFLAKLAKATNKKLKMPRIV